MNFKLFTTLLLAAVISVIVSEIVYFGRGAQKGGKLSSQRAFDSQVQDGEDKYCILCRYLLVVIHDWRVRDLIVKGDEPNSFVGAVEGSERFYLDFYFLNTFFLALTSVLAVLLFNLERVFRFTEFERMLIIGMVPVLIGITERTWSYFDVSSYFFELLIIYFFLRFSTRYYLISLLAIGMFIVLSTLNKDSSSFSVSMVALLLLSRFGISLRVILSITGLAGCYVLTYIGLRHYIIDQKNVLILTNQGGLNLTGVIFCLLFFYLPMSITGSKENKWLIGVFFLFSLTYIFMYPEDGAFWEIRLFMPLFLGALFLSKLDTSVHIIKWQSLAASFRKIGKGHS